MKKKFLSYALVASMAVTSVPTTALADDGNAAAVQAGADENSGEDNGIATYASVTAAVTDDEGDPNNTTIHFKVVKDSSGKYVSDDGSSTIRIKLSGATFDTANLPTDDCIEEWCENPTNFYAYVKKVVGDDATIEITISRKGESVPATTPETGKLTIIIPAKYIKVTGGGDATDVKIQDAVTYIILDKLGGSVALTVGDNNTTVTSKTELRVGDTLTADVDGVEGLPSTGGTAKTTYQWYCQDAKISGATEPTYILTAADVGKSIKVRVSRSDAGGTNYKDSDTTAAVQKKVGPEAPTGLKGVAPTDKDGEGTITGLTTDMQYRASSGAGDSADAAVADSEWKEVTATNMTFEPGTYYVRLAATDDTEAGAAAEVVVPEYEAPKIDIKDATVTINPQTAIYDGSEQTPAITVTVSGKDLTETTDYDVSYDLKVAGEGQLSSDKKPVGAGTYTVTITGKGDYTGTATGTFTINKAESGTPDEKLFAPQAPTTTGGSDGKITITGVDTEKALEYKGPNDQDYTAVTLQNGSGTITGVAGDYLVRYAETDNYKVGDATITIKIPEGSEDVGTLVFENTKNMYNIPAGKQGEVYTGEDALTAAGGIEPYKFTIVNGPDGLSINEENKLVYTRPTVREGKTIAVIKVTDNSSPVQEKEITIDIDEVSEDTSTKFQVSFDSKGGTTVPSQSVAEGGKVTKPTNPTRSGYSFTGWFADEACTKAFDFTTAVGGNITLYAGWKANSSGGHSGGYGSGGGKSSTTTPTTPATDNKSETTTTTNPDGSTTTTVTNPDGSSVETTTYPDGSKLVTETDENGVQTITETRADGTEIRTEISRRGEVKSDIKLPEGADEVTVKIPTENRPTAGTVAVIVNPDGSREIILYSSADRDGVTITLDRDATVEIIDNARVFDDVPSSSWAKDSIDFVTARELFAGVSDTEFGYNAPMTRAMLMTVLARLDGQDTSGGATWYAKGMAWAVAKGISDGTNPNGTITREQLAAMLYRYAGSPATFGNLDIFLDSGRVSGYVVDALRWAVEQGIISGMGDGTLDPQGNATRAQVAAMLMRFMNAMS